MIRNLFLTAFRNIRRHFSYALLNIFGLTLGIATCIIIFLVVRNELSYDNFHSKADRTYRVTLNVGGKDVGSQVVKVVEDIWLNER